MIRKYEFYLLNFFLFIFILLDVGLTYIGITKLGRVESNTLMANLFDKMGLIPGLIVNVIYSLIFMAILFFLFKFARSEKKKVFIFWVILIVTFFRLFIDGIWFGILFY